MQNRISDFQFLPSSLRFAIARSTRSTAFAIHRVVRRVAPGLVRELALDALQPRAGERLTDQSVDELLVHAIKTDTRLRFFREDVIVFAGPRCSLDTLRAFKAARPELAARVECLFGGQVAGAVRADERVRRRDRRGLELGPATSGPRDLAPRAVDGTGLERSGAREWPPEEVVLAPWEVDAESIPPSRAARSGEAGAPRGTQADAGDPQEDA